MIFEGVGDFGKSPKSVMNEILMCSCYEYYLNREL